MDGDGREEVVREYLYGARDEEGRTWLVLALYFRLPLAGLVPSVNAREGARSHMSFLRILFLEHRRGHGNPLTSVFFS
jgi:hypothetical protein